MSSTGSLTPPPLSPLSPTLPETELPILPSSSRTFGSTQSTQSTQSTPTPSSVLEFKIPKTNAYIFTAGLFTRTKLATSPASVEYVCTQPTCSYKATVLSAKVLSTGNLLKHYHSRHKDIPTNYKDAKDRSAAFAVAKPKEDFFRTYNTGLSSEKARKLLLNLIISNNLKLGLVESLSFRAFVAAHNPYVYIPK
jgi:hypothetical protein